VTNTSYPIFLLMHPRDHVAHWLTPGAFKVGVNATWMEFPSTGCTDDGTGVGTCPSGAGTANPGWTSSSAVADWQFEEQLNSERRGGWVEAWGRLRAWRWGGARPQVGVGMHSRSVALRWLRVQEWLLTCLHSNGAHLPPAFQATPTFGA
jgi:hypothetical protein